MSTVAISTPFNISLDFEIAEFHKRFFAYLIDLFIQGCFLRGMVLIFFEGMELRGHGTTGIVILFVLVPLILYHPFMEVFNNGQSLGKKVMAIKVMSLEGGAPHIGQYLLRWIFRTFEWVAVFMLVLGDVYTLIIYWFLAGLTTVLTIAISKRSQRLGDMAAGTAVVSTKIKLGLSDTIFQEVSSSDFKVAFPEVMRLSDRDINAIKTVLKQSRKTNHFETAHRVAYKIKEVLKIESNLDVSDFLKKLLEDYNYLATKE